MLFHIHLSAAETHAFGFKAKALFHGGIATQLDFSAYTQDALPGQVESSMQYLGDLACHSRRAHSSSDRSIGGNLASWNPADGGLDLHSGI
jgi:hypothetical protein